MFFHIDIKYLPGMAGESSRKYVAHQKIGNK